MQRENSTLDHHFDEVVKEFSSIWRSQLHKVNCGRDLSRMSRSIGLERELDDGKFQKIDILEKRNNLGDNKDVVIPSLLNKISQLINERIGIEEDMEPTTTVEEFRRRCPDITQTVLFSTFLNEKYGSCSRTMKLLKFTDQSYVLFFLGILMKILKRKEVPPPTDHVSRNLPPKNIADRDRMFFKDCRGKWKIRIRLFKNGRFSFTHIRTEQMMMIREKRFFNLFQFSWKLTVVLDSILFRNIDEITARLVPTINEKYFDWECCNKDLKDGIDIDRSWFEKMTMELFEGASRTNLTEKYLEKLKLFESKISFIKEELRIEKKEEEIINLLLESNGDTRQVVLDYFRPIILSENIRKNKEKGMENQQQLNEDIILSKEEKDLIIKRRKRSQKTRKSSNEEKKRMKEEKKKIKIERKRARKEEKKRLKEERRRKRRESSVKNKREKAEMKKRSKLARIIKNRDRDICGDDGEGDTSSSLEETSEEDPTTTTSDEDSSSDDDEEEEGESDE